MVKQFILLLLIFNLLNIISCKPTIETPNSITRDFIVALPGNEKINKRSVDDAMESDEDDSSDNFTSLDDDESENSQEISYGSSENYYPSVSAFATDQKSDFEIGQRFGRSIDTTNNENDDGMETAENGLVFRPLFRTKNNFGQRVARSIKDSNDEMETAESGIIFRPLFRTKSSFAIKDRVRRNIDNSKTDQYVDDMEAAANGLVFRPIFRTNNRFALGQRSRRSVNYDVGISPSAVNVVNSNDLHSRRNLRINRSTKGKESLSENNNVNGVPKSMAFRS